VPARLLMTNRRPRFFGLPSSKTLHRHYRAKTAFSVVIRLYQDIDRALNVALIERLAPGHKLEISRMPFVLKVDLCAALRILRSDSRPAFIVVNKL